MTRTEALLLILICLLPFDVARAQTTQPDDPLRVLLLTIGPGEAVYEKFGHNALILIDARSDAQSAYNYGVFDFDQPNFIGRFVLGRMLYTLEAIHGDEVNGMIAHYEQTGREMWLQELNLLPPQKQKLADFLARNALPENKDYLYDYYRDNCSTRIRDAIDQAVDHQLRDQWTNILTESTYRRFTRVGYADSPLVYLGLSLAMGPLLDQNLTLWEAGFVPMTLRENLSRAKLNGEPIVLWEKKLQAANIATPEQPPNCLWLFAAAGVAIGLLFFLCGLRYAQSRRTRRTLLIGGMIWSMLAGLSGVFLLFIQLFTNHEAGKWNQNFFVLSPVSLAMVWLLPGALRDEKRLIRARKLAIVIFILAALPVLIKMRSTPPQQNWEMLSLALPAHLGLALALRKPAKRPLMQQEKS